MRIKLKPVIADAVGTSTNSLVIILLSYFQFFSLLKKLYEESQSKLNETTDELEVMKKYLNEMLEEGRQV